MHVFQCRPFLEIPVMPDPTLHCIHSQAWKVFKLFRGVIGFWTTQHEMETDDDHATVREKLSLVQNILFGDYPDTLPAHSRKTRFNMLQTTCPCIWLQCALVRLIYTYIGMCSLELYLLITPLKSPHYSSAKPSLHPNAAPPITCWPPLHPLPFRFHNE